MGNFISSRTATKKEEGEQAENAGRKDYMSMEEYS